VGGRSVAEEKSRPGVLRWRWRVRGAEGESEERRRRENNLMEPAKLGSGWLVEILRWRGARGRRGEEQCGR
jgi:hypothetical protein